MAASVLRKESEYRPCCLAKLWHLFLLPALQAAADGLAPAWLLPLCRGKLLLLLALACGFDGYRVQCDTILSAVQLLPKELPRRGDER